MVEGKDAWEYLPTSSKWGSSFVAKKKQVEQEMIGDTEQDTTIVEQLLFRGNFILSAIRKVWKYVHEKLETTWYQPSTLMSCTKLDNGTQK